MFINVYVPRTRRRVLGRCEIAQRTVRALSVVILLPKVGQRLGLRHGLELLQLQELVPQPAVERLHIAVLPGASRGYVQRPRTRRLQVRADGCRREFRAVVAPDAMGRGPTPGHHLGQDLLDLFGGHATSRLKRQAFTSIFINQTQPLEAPTVAGAVEEEVPGPAIGLAPRRPQVAAVLVLTMRPPRLGRGPRPGQLQSRLTPEAMDGLLVDRVALASQQRPDPAVTVPGVFPRQVLDPAGQGEPLVAVPGCVSHG